MLPKLASSMRSASKASTIASRRIQAGRDPVIRRLALEGCIDHEHIVAARKYAGSRITFFGANVPGQL